jgi:hypothetical protein
MSFFVLFNDSLDLSDTNVIGPFDTEAEADRWIEDMSEHYEKDYCFVFEPEDPEEVKKVYNGQV